MNENDAVLCQKASKNIIGHILRTVDMFVRKWRKCLPQIFQKSVKKRRNRAGDLDLGHWLPFE